MLAVAVLRTVRHVLRIGRDVRSIQSSPGIKKTWSKGDCIVLLSISPHLFCYLLRVYKSVIMRL